MEQVGANRVSVAERLGVASGSGPSTVKTFTFTDPDGIDDFTILNVLINNALDGRSACYLAYDVPSSTVYLVNDSGKGLTWISRPSAGNVATDNARSTGRRLRSSRAEIGSV